MRHHRRPLQRVLISRFLLLFLLLLPPLTSPPPSLLAQDNSSFIDLVRDIEADELPVTAAGGIVFVDEAQSFLLFAPIAEGTATGQTTVTAVTTYADLLGALALPLAVDPLTAAVDPDNQLWLWAPASRELLQFTLQDNGLPATTPTIRLALPDVSGAMQGLAVAPDGQSLYLLAADTLTIQQVRLPVEGAAVTPLTSTDLRQYGLTQARGLALHPQRQHLFTLDPTTQTLYEFTLAGALVAHYELAPFQLHHAQGFVFAPSGDPTDEPERLHLYVMDQLAQPEVSAPQETAPSNLPPRLYLPLAMGGAGTTAAANSKTRIVELTFAPPVEPAQAASVTTVGVLVQMVKTSLYQPPSPDPSDLAYIPATPYLITGERLLISDGEVDEMAIYAGANLFETTLNGALQRTYTTLSDLTREPVGLAFNPNNGHLFITDDDNIRPLIEVDPGPDKIYRTPDDSSTKFSTRDRYGVSDPEGVEYARINGVDWLFFADGLGNEVYLVRPGANGKFDGVDDQVTHFDSAALGVTDPEGIAYHPTSGTLYLVGKPATRVVEITLTGGLVRYIDIAAAKAKKPAGLTFAPGSQNADQWNLYIVDRNVDNNSDPNENDGLLYEIALAPAGNQPPTVNAGADMAIVWPAAASLNGSASDDGLPQPPTLVTTWSYVNGPGSVTFANPQARQTTATFSATGIYTLRLTASDGQLSASDDVVVTVNTQSTATDLIYLSTGSDGTVGGVAYRDEDMLVYNPATQQWALLLDGSDVGLSSVDIDAFDLLADGPILLSVDKGFTLAGLGSVRDTDVLRFTPTSLGATTVGAFAFYLRGADVGLTTSDEDIDAIDLLPDGRLLFSTAGNASLLGVTSADEDLVALDLTRRTATLYFDGSQMGMTSSSEDINGLWVDSAGKLYLTTRGAFTVPGLQGSATDIFVCQSQTPGTPITRCAFSGYWQGAPVGLGSNPIDALAIGGNVPLMLSTVQSSAVGDNLAEAPGQADAASDESETAEPIE
ncbi:MAG: hypothetical protein DYG89_46240 [Caldilinea sp. CFX5]|nr:hypothetical protein [Caldilinea sp. CFX5]